MPVSQWSPSIPNEHETLLNFYKPSVFLQYCSLSVQPPRCYSIRMHSTAALFISYLSFLRFYFT